MHGIAPEERSGNAVHGYPQTTACTFCGEPAALRDRRATGIRIIAAAFVAGAATGWYFGWIVGVMDWLLVLAPGLYMSFRAERFVYHCRECTNVMAAVGRGRGEPPVTPR